jgi:hypothetical protein
MFVLHLLHYSMMSRRIQGVLVDLFGNEESFVDAANDLIAYSIDSSALMISLTFVGHCSPEWF